MPRPKSVKSNVQNNHGQHNRSSEKILFESQPNMILYSDNFILKIVVLFFLVFMFNPVLALAFHFQGHLKSFYNIDISNFTYLVELAILFCILIVLIKLVLDVLDWNSTVYTLTEKRIIINRGLFNKETITMPYAKVQDIDIVQSFIDRIIGVGDIIIYGGHDNSETILDAVPNPGDVEEIILNRIDNYQSNFNQYQQGYIQPNQQEYIQPNQAGGYKDNCYNNGNYTQYNNNYNNSHYMQDDSNQNSYIKDNSNQNYHRQNNYNQQQYNKNNNYRQKSKNNRNYYRDDDFTSDNKGYDDKKNNRHAHYYQNKNDNSIKNRDYTRVSEIEYNNNKLSRDELISKNKRKFKKS